MLKSTEDWKKEKHSEVIKYIRDNYNGYLKNELPEIEDLLYKLLRVHYLDCGDMLVKLHRLYGALKNRLDMLAVKKRMALFPAIIDYERKPSEDILEKILKEINEMEKEYDDIIDIVKKIKDITDEYTVPPCGCPTFDSTYEKLEALESILLKNIYLEREIIYNSF